MAFGMLAAGTSVIRVQGCLVTLTLLFITLLDGTTRKETISTQPGQGDVRQQHPDKTFVSLSHIYASSSSRHM